MTGTPSYTRRGADGIAGNWWPVKAADYALTPGIYHDALSLVGLQSMNLSWHILIVRLALNNRVELGPHPG
jgi:hypothetical protein